MCFYYQLNKSAKAVQKRFNAEFHHGQLNLFLEENSIINGFSHPKVPIIANNEPNKIQLSEWGLLPSWAKERKFNNNTLNAKIETLSEKPSFKNYISNRCLIPADGFYEWQWLDERGKRKEKYFIHLNNDELFAFAGIWNIWIDPHNNETIHTFSIITTEANELMSYIHNSKKRMPVIISPDFEDRWLKDGSFEMCNDSLIATPLYQDLTLF